MGRKRKELTIRSEESSIIMGVVFAICAVLLLLSAFVNAPAFQLLKVNLGSCALLLFFLTANLALRMFGFNYPLNKNSALVGQSFTFITISALTYLITPIANSLEISGKFGESVGRLLADIFSKDVAILILVMLILILIPLSLSISLVSIKEMLIAISSLLKRFINFVRGKDKKDEEIQPIDQSAEKNENTNTMMSDLHKEDKEKEVKPVEVRSVVEQVRKEPVRESVSNNETIETKQEVENEKEKQLTKDEQVWEDEKDHGLYNSVLKYPNWELPPIDLLDQYKKIKPPAEGIKRNMQIIEQTLQSFGITAKVIDAKIGPTVTQYAVNIALGTKVAKIANLKNDLALALAIKGDIRIEAPIPGTSYVGIECANPFAVTVQVREIMEHLVAMHHNLGLGVVIGKAIDGSAVVTDIQKMPHFLVAGTTGSGKSVLTNSFITSLLMTKTPDEVRLILVDPKQVEFSDYNGIPHLLTPVIVDIDKVLNALKWAVAEMERRYTIFRQAKVRNLIGYNQLMGFSALPYIVIVIDEMADLMLTLGKELETQIVKLAQKARATGIHLILATQRPSVDVITGLIKANIPGRVGLKVATQIDSRVILDQIGAESLLGKGDLLFMEPDKNKPQRIQAVWLSPPEVQKVVEYLKNQVGNEELGYMEEVTVAPVKEDTEEIMNTPNGNVSDQLMLEAIRTVMAAKKGSASLLQRRLSIGYNRAARILDEMEQLGIVSTQESPSKPREVYVSVAESYLIENSEKNT